MKITAGLFALILALMLPAAGAADQVEKTNNPERKVTVSGLSERTYKSLERIHERIGEEQYGEALESSQKLLRRVEGTPFEEANVLQTIGHILSAQEKYDQAIEYFQRAVAANALPNRTHFDMMFSVAQLQIAQDRFQDGLKTWDEWAAVTDEIHADAYVLKASAHAQLERYEPALAAIDKAIGLAEKPKEGWYGLKLASHFELKQFVKAIETLEILVRNWPSKKKYWTQLASLQLQQKRDQDALATLALAHREGLLDKQADYLQLFNLYGYLKVPLRAAEVLSEGIEKEIVEPTKAHYEQLASAWFSAREYDEAVSAYQEAAEKALDGKIDQQIAYIEVERENWENVRTSANAAVDKGGLNETDQGNMLVLVGMANWELGNAKAAQDAFNRAKRFDKSRSAANEWLNLIAERLAADAAKAESEAAASG